MASKKIEKIKTVWVIEKIGDEPGYHYMSKGDITLYLDEQYMWHYCKVIADGSSSYNIYETELTYVNDLRKVYQNGKFGCLEVPIINRWLHWKYDVITNRLLNGTIEKYCKSWSHNYSTTRLEVMVKEFTTNKHAGYYANKMRQLSHDEILEYSRKYENNRNENDKETEVYNCLYDNVRLATHFMYIIRGLNNQDECWNKELPRNSLQPEICAENHPTAETIMQHWHQDVQDMQDCLEFATLLTGNTIKPKWENANLAMMLCYTNGWHENRNAGKFFDVEHNEVKGNMLDNLYNSTSPFRDKLINSFKMFVQEKKPLNGMLANVFRRMLNGSQEFVAIQTHRRLTSMWKSKNLLYVLPVGGGVYTFVYHNPALVNASYILDEENKSEKLQELLLNTK